MSSVAFDKIVPFWQDFVLDDVPCTLPFKERVALCLCLIDSSVDRCEYSKPCFGSCPGCQFTCLFNGVEHGSAPNSGDLREESVLYRIPLGAVRRVMGYSDVNAQPLGQLDKTPLELPAPYVVRASTVTEYEYALRIWVNVSEVLLPLLGKAFTGKLGSVVANSEGHVTGVPLDIIDAIRHYLAIGECGIVVVVDLYGFSCVGRAVVTPEGAKQFLLLRVNAEYGYAVLLTVPPVLFYDFELLVPLLTVSHWQGFHGLTAGVAFCLDDLPDGVQTYLFMVLFCEYALYLRGGQAEPLRVGILGKPGYVKCHNLAEDGYVLGMDGKYALPATSLFANSALIEVLFGLKFMATSVDGLAVDARDAADKAYAMPAMPVGYNGDELSRLSLVCVLEVLHLFVSYYICWNFRNLHNCLEFSCKGTIFSADLRK